MSERYKHLLNLCACLLLLGVQGVIFGYTWYLHYVPAMDYLHRPYNKGNWAVIGIYLLMVFFFTKTFDGYRFGYARLMDMFLSNTLACMAAAFFAYFEVCLVANDYLSVVPLLCVCGGDILFALPFIYVVRKLYSALYPPHQMLVIYGEYSVEDLVKKINSRGDKYNICSSIRYTEGFDAIYEKIDAHSAVVLADLPAAERNIIAKYCYRQGVRVYVPPKITDIMMRGADDSHLFDTPLLLMRNGGPNINSLVIKRIMDIVTALLGLIIASPFMLLIAIAIKLYDGGPIFYKQPRLTKDGKEFMIYKFRSMTTDSEKHGARLASKTDSRITPVGKIIRGIHFDELPQIFNILKGDMSLVGPRPERKVIAEQYMEEIPDFDMRLKVKAGLTGYAQVYGTYNTTPLDKLKLDLTYIENYSVLLDIKIILLTVKILFQKENAEGVDDSQTTALKKK